MPAARGTVEVTASVDLADALDLETALAQAAAELIAAGSTESLDVRRSMALGVIARHYLGDALNTGRPRPARWSSPARW